MKKEPRQHTLGRVFDFESHQIRKLWIGHYSSRFDHTIKQISFKDQNIFNQVKNSASYRPKKKNVHPILNFHVNQHENNNTDCLTGQNSQWLDYNMYYLAFYRPKIQQIYFFRRLMLFENEERFTIDKFNLNILKSQKFHI